MYEIFFLTKKVFISPSQFSKKQNQFAYFLSRDVVRIVFHGYIRAWHPLSEQMMHTFQRWACCQDETVGWSNSSAAPDIDVIFAGLHPSVEEGGGLKWE